MRAVCAARVSRVRGAAARARTYVCTRVDSDGVRLYDGDGTAGARRAGPRSSSRCGRSSPRGTSLAKKLAATHPVGSLRRCVRSGQLELLRSSTLNHVPTWTRVRSTDESCWTSLRQTSVTQTCRTTAPSSKPRQWTLLRAPGSGSKTIMFNWSARQPAPAS